MYIIPKGTPMPMPTKTTSDRRLWGVRDFVREKSLRHRQSQKMPDKTEDSCHPLSEEKLARYVEQRIQERANLGHLYQIEDGPDGPEAAFTDCAAASLWRVVQDAIREAGWKITTASGSTT
jgi:hypothetical protein